MTACDSGETGLVIFVTEINDKGAPSRKTGCCVLRRICCNYFIAKFQRMDRVVFI